jgi:hypothetical protein
MRLRWLLALFAFATVPAFGQQRPLITEIPEPIARGSVRLELGMDFSQDQPFPLSGLRGDLVRLGVIGARFGLSPSVEFQIGGVLGNSLSIRQRRPAPLSGLLTVTGNSTTDIGDFLFATKIKLRGESPTWPSLSFRIGAELPNKSNQEGLGSDTNRIFGSLLAGKRFGSTYLFSNLGLALIDNPTLVASQSDKLIYGVAFIQDINGRLRLLGELQGMTGNPHPGAEDTSQVRFGAQVRAAGLVWDVSGLAGLTKADADSGVIFGITRDFQIVKVPGKPQNAFKFDSLLFPRKTELR